jgi:hypothetical protein
MEPSLMGAMQRLFTVRVVPLKAERSHDIAVGTTVPERLALVQELTHEGWVLSGKPFPQYARSAAPRPYCASSEGPTAAARVNQDFLDFLAALLQAKARFLVVGAHALAVHGVPRATGDIDIWIARNPENVERVWRACIEFGVPVQSLNISQADLLQPNMVVQIGLPPRRIDLLTDISGLSFADAWAERFDHSVGVLVIPFLGRTALIQNKRASGRLKDLADVEALENVSE